MSGLTDQDARALTYLALRIRTETYGAGPWDEAGTYANIAKLVGRSLALTSESIVRHAADKGARTPGVLLGAYTPAPLEHEDHARGNPKPGEDCPRHAGQWPDFCAGCKTDTIPAYYDPEPGERVADPRAAARAALATAKHTAPTDEETADA
jgi:hypothetical protein